MPLPSSSAKYRKPPIAGTISVTYVGEVSALPIAVRHEIFNAFHSAAIMRRGENGSLPMGYPDVGIMGFGKMPSDCAQILLNHQVKVNFILETEESPFSSLESLCSRNDITYKKASPKETAAFLNDLNDPAILLSVNNNFLFPESVVRKRNLRIVNFHNALLPSYRGHGQSIPRWVVYNGETHHGVTWHLVDENIDSGNILCNEVFPVSNDDTALSVMMRSIRVGIGLFERWWERFLDFGFCGMDQSEDMRPIYKSPLQNRVYKKKDLPNNGRMDPLWDFDQTARFLRSMDYSRLQVSAPPEIALENGICSIRRYRVEERRRVPLEQGKKEGKGQAEQTCTLYYDKGVIRLYLQNTKEPSAKQEEEVSVAVGKPSDPP